MHNPLSRSLTPHARLAALLALLLALGAVAPGVTKALAASVSADLCSAAARGAAGAPLPHDRWHDATCALCLSAGGSDAAPPPAARVLATAIHRAVPRPGHTSTDVVRRGWLAAVPRGPPVGPTA